MPRTAPAKNPHPILTTPKKVAAKSVRGSRAGDGKFTVGNPGGPGNPHARHCARMLALLRTSISDEEMVDIIRALVEKARKGDTSAAKILLSYKIGKPGEAPNPDQIDRDEWEHFQKDTINLQEMQQVLSSLPAKVGNDIARTALPIMTEARTKVLAANLGKRGSAPKETIEPPVDVDTARNQTSPLPNRCSRQAPQGNPKKAHPKSDAPVHISRPVTNDARSSGSKPDPIANGKSKRRTTGKGKRKLVRNQWLQTVAKRLNA
jgi:hypothetical protein